MFFFFFFSSRRRHTRSLRDWSSDVCSSDLTRHLFTTSITYDVPKAPWATGWSSYLVNGWQVSSLWNFHTGQPWNSSLAFQNLIGDPFRSDSNYTIKHSFTRDIIQSGKGTGPGIQW